MQKKEYLSKERHAELIKELDYLKTKKRQEIAEALEYARSLGDLSENAEFNKAREDQAMIEDRIAQLEDILANAILVKEHHSSIAEVGTKVHVQKKGEKEIIVFTLVGSEEINPDENKISLQSPIGQALSGKSKGEDIIVKTPLKEITYTIVEIE